MKDIDKYYHVLVYMKGEYRFITSVNNSTKTFLCEKGKTPKVFKKTYAEDMLYCVKLNGFDAYIVESFFTPIEANIFASKPSKYCKIKLVDSGRVITMNFAENPTDLSFGCDSRIEFQLYENEADSNEGVGVAVTDGSMDCISKNRDYKSIKDAIPDVFDCLFYDNYKPQYVIIEEE